jgi:hypothetical protein
MAEKLPHPPEPSTPGVAPPPGAPAGDQASFARKPLRPMHNGRRWRANVKSSPKTSGLDRDFRRRAG